MENGEPKALNDVQMKEYLDNKCNLVLYSDIHKYNDLESLLGQYNRCIILYIWKKINGHNSGHWISICKTKDNKIRFTDSYGAIPDKPLEKLTRFERERLNQDYKYLSDLLINSKYELEYMDKVLQNKTSKVCGYYSILSCIMADRPLKEFENLFSKNTKDNDKLVYYLVSGGTY
jgi:hypothetical protein